MAELTYDDVSKLIKADFDAGLLFWLPRPEELFANYRAFRIWNANFPGREALAYVGFHGYKQGTIFSRKFKAHRVMWLLHTGSWPSEQIDHIDGDRLNNRIINLREASDAENRKNQKMPKTNSSGVIGVSWRKDRERWYAQINIDGRMKNLGLFRTFEAAVNARRDAEAKYGYHPNHGRVA